MIAVNRAHGARIVLCHAIAGVLIWLRLLATLSRTIRAENPFVGPEKWSVRACPRAPNPIQLRAERSSQTVAAEIARQVFKPAKLRLPLRRLHLLRVQATAQNPSVEQ